MFAARKGIWGVGDDELWSLSLITFWLIRYVIMADLHQSSARWSLQVLVMFLLTSFVEWHCLLRLLIRYFFLVQFFNRSAPPYHGFIIMNRLSKTNQVEPITRDLELQREDPYLLYRNPKRETCPVMISLCRGPSLKLIMIVIVLFFGRLQ